MQASGAVSVVVTPRLGFIQTADGKAVEFVARQYRHGTTLPASGEADPGGLLAGADEAGTAHAAFIAVIARHRHPARDADPPQV